MSPDDLSAMSGTTLARALIANSFILSNDARVSRYRSGMSVNIRQDSATLPRGENPFLNSPYWRDKRISSGDIILTPNSGRNSSVPPVPPLPSGSCLYRKGSRSARASGSGSDTQDKSRRQSGAALSRHASSSSLRSLRRSGTEPLASVVQSSSSSDVPVSERPTSRRISRIVELPSPITSAPGTPAPSPEDTHSISLSVSPMSKQIYSGEETTPLDYDVPTPSPDPPSRPSRRHSQSDTSLSPGSAQSTSIADVLDDYMFISSADSQSALSPMASESSASMRAPAPYRTAPKRASKKRKESKVANSSSVVAVGKGNCSLFPLTFSCF